jgi:hypothetical protein
MPATYEPIATYTFPNSSSSSYTFNSIPGTYTDLAIIGHVKSTSASSLSLRFNGDGGSNYWTYVKYPTGSTVTNARYTSQTVGYINYLGTPFNSGQFGAVNIDILNYASTSMWKHGLSRTGSYQFGPEFAVMQWRSTSAITSLSIFAGAAFDTGTTFTLYGIKAA